MSGTLPPVADPLWVNVTTSSAWSIPVEWWPIIGLLIGLICGILIAAVVIPWGRSP